MSKPKYYIFIILLALSSEAHAIKKIPQQIGYKQELSNYQTPRNTTQDKVDLHPGSTNSPRILTLPYALKMTLLNNPHLRSSAWEIQGRQAQIFQNALLDNPVAETELENLGINEFSLNLSQTIPLGGKLFTGVQIAKIEHARSVFNFEVDRLNLLVEVSREFIQALRVKKKLELIEELLLTSQETYFTALKRKKAGAGSEIDVLQAQKGLEIIKLNREKEIKNYWMRLNTISGYWGNNTNNFTNIQGNLNIPRSIPEFYALSSRISNSPALLSWVIDHELLQKQKNLAVAQVVPDLDITAGYKRNNQSLENSLNLAVSLELPLWNFNQGDIKQAKIYLHQSLYERKEIENTLFKELINKYNEFSSLFQELVLLETKVLPLVQQTYVEGRKMYANGNISLTELLIFQNDLINTRETLVDLSADFYSLKYGLEQLLGFELNLNDKE